MTKQIRHQRMSARGRVFSAGRRTMGHKAFIHGDFDGDRIQNIDDQRPFDPEINVAVDRDSRYSKMIRKFERFRATHKRSNLEVKAKLRKKFPQREGYRVISRIKSTPSMINKLQNKYLSELKDISGVAVISRDLKRQVKADAKMQKVKDINIVDREDFYSKSNKRRPFYKAIHYDIKARGKSGEIQLKTERQFKFHDTMHKGHKGGGRPTGRYTHQGAIKRSNTLNRWDARGPIIRKTKKVVRLPKRSSQGFLSV